MRIDTRSQYVQFLKDLQTEHTHALTLTLIHSRDLECHFNERLRLEDTVRHLLYRIARSCFKRRHKREGCRIGAVTVIEKGHLNERTHAHLAIACPPGISEGPFVKLVADAIGRCKSLGHFVLKPITDVDGWAGYMAKDGTQAFSSSCTQQAKH